MTDTPTTGGTVRYHDAQFDRVREMWEMQHVRNGEWYEFTAAEGEAMGLTPPEPAPAPLNVTCNGHSIELDGDAVDELIQGWAGRTFVVDTPFATTMVALANLFRDARQESQPASEPCPHCNDEGVVHTHDGLPLGPCDCVNPQPEQDDTASGIDFDALPIGTVLKSRYGYLFTKGADGNWWDGEQREPAPSQILEPYTVVITGEPTAPLSPGEHLRGLLAGRDDAEELWNEAKRWFPVGDWADARLGRAIGDAAREVPSPAREVHG